MNKNLLHVLTILESIEKITIYTKDYSNSQEFFNANVQKDFNAVLNLLIAIGEESKKIDSNLKLNSSEIDWKAISDLRNELSHNYRGVDADIIWDIVCNYLAPLKFACLEIFKNMKKVDEELLEILDTIYYQNIQYLRKFLI